MTFDQIVNRVMSRLNLTSDTARTRVEEEVNDVYKEFVSSMGMETTVRGEADGVVTVDSRYVTFGTESDEEDDVRVIKILAVFLPDQPVPWNVLYSATFDELRNAFPVQGGPFRRYAVAKTHPTSVEIFLDGPVTDADMVIRADVELASDTLVGSAKPNFTENFHDLLVYGAMSLELDKMEKGSRSEQMQARFEKRASELRLQIAKDAYLAIHQAKNNSWGGGYGGGIAVTVPVVADEIIALGETSDGDEVPVLVSDDGTVELA